MDTLSFLKHVLPEGGVHYLVLFPADKPYKIHKAFEDLEGMAAAVSRMDTNPQVTAVYFACSSFKQPYIEVDKDGKTRRKYRVEENWNRAKAFWMDVDCGAEKAAKGAGYATKREAAAAVVAFCKQINWPTPTIVDSGGGLHCYWTLTKPIKHGSWVKVAGALKACTKHFGLLADPTRTADFASILRPVGSHNRKGDAKEVKLLKLGTDSDPAVLAKALSTVVGENSIAPARPEAPSTTLNSDLTGHLAQYPEIDSFGSLAADKCAQLAAMRDTEGDVGYEHWRGVIGVLRYCKDGVDLAEAWSAKRGSTGHSQTDWAHKYETWSAGPTTCDFFAECNAGACEGCAFKGKIKSPIVLGRVMPTTEEKPTEAIIEDVKETVVIPALPGGYSWDGKLLTRMVLNSEEVLEPKVFSRNLFYPTMRIKADDGTFKIGMRMHLHDQRIRDFQMPFEAIASQTDLLRALAKYEIMQTNNKDSNTHLTAYLRDSLEELKQRSREINTLSTFGWKEDLKGFLIGDRYYKSDGTMQRVLLTGYAANHLSAVDKVVGTVGGYASAINHVYNRPGMECMQYALCSGWGSILTVFCEDLYCGLTVALVGGESGRGKSTATWASVSAFGNADALTLKSDESGTKNAIWATLGTFGNIPIVFDELTKIGSDEFSSFAYNVSLGEEKRRLISIGGGSGVKFAAQSKWRMSPFVTSNRDLHGLLAMAQANSQAEAVRLIQIHVDKYDIPQLGVSEVHSAMSQIKQNRGAAGEALIKYAVTHTNEMFDRIRQKVALMDEALPGPKYRYYRSHAACTLVAAELARQLGIAAFNTHALQNFAVDLLRSLADTIQTSNTITSEDAFSRAVAALSSRIMVTGEFRDSRAGVSVESPRNRIIGEIAGRYILGTPYQTEFTGRLFLCSKTLRDWCMNNRLEMDNVLDSLRAKGALLSADERVTLTKGTDVPRVQQRCIIVDTLKLEAGVGPILVVDNNVDAKGKTGS